MTALMPDIISTNIPGRSAIELVSWYPEFQHYYQNCEPLVKTWFVKNAEPDWVYVDCGANIGYYSILFSQLSPEGHVHAVEPTATADMLARNLEHNRAGNVTVHRVAVGSATGNKSDGIFRIWGKEPERQQYPFTTLDDLVESLMLHRLDAVKIDVDSYDFEVLLGGGRILEFFDPWVIVELNHALTKRNHTPEEAFALMRSRGYLQAAKIDLDNYLFRRQERFDSPNVIDLERYR